MPTEAKTNTSDARQLLLIVDDDPLIRELLHAYLSQEGYEVHCAATAELAETFLASQTENMALSHDRAFTVFSYLQDHGIAGNRLAFEGYGPTKPLASNDTEAGRARNRRTEFVITSR